MRYLLNTMSPRPLVLTALVLAPLACGALGPATSRGGADDDGSDETSSGETATLPEPGPSDIVVATFNVRLFFDTVCDSGSCGGGAFEDEYSAAEFAYRADRLASAIAGLGADLVLLQEIENQACLDALAERLPELPSAALGESGYPASVDTAVLSRLPLVELRRHEGPIALPGGGQTSFARVFLEAEFSAEGRRVVAFAAHFKSKSDDDPERRLAEAREARAIVDARVAAQPDALVVMGGDLNDVPGSPPLSALEGEGGLSRVAADLGEDDWTYAYKDQRQAIDHLFVATGASGGSYVPGTARVLRGPGTDGWGGSDHAALRATFRLAD